MMPAIIDLFGHTTDGVAGGDGGVYGVVVESAETGDGGSKGDQASCDVAVSKKSVPGT